MKVDMRVSTAKTKLMSSSLLVSVKEICSKGAESQVKWSMTLESQKSTCSPKVSGGKITKNPVSQEPPTSW